jgi:transcriptional regulator with XRE-family HTH domain
MITTRKKLFNVLKSKQFKNKLGPSLFLTRLSGIVYKNRVNKKLSQKQLAKTVGTTQRIISEIENGNYNIGSDLLYRIFKALDKQLFCEGKDLISGQKGWFELKLGMATTSNFQSSITKKDSIIFG